jgi:nucleotide-binding universal stress UspA family protein
MEIRSILVNVGLSPSQGALSYGAALAQEFGAELVGVAAAEPKLAFSGADDAQVAAEFYSAERASIENLLAQAEGQFRAAVPAGVQSRWDSFVANTTDTIANEARRCDVVVTATGDGSGVESLDAGHLIVSCGRPVLVVADHGSKFRLDRIVVAWKDTREARRAVSDALPFLQRADAVKVITRNEGENTSETDSLNDVLAWLSLHGVRATSEVVGHEADFLEQLGATSVTGGPDLVVAGGYGHSRLREWLFGGVTRELLNANGVNRLFSN